MKKLHLQSTKGMSLIGALMTLVIMGILIVGAYQLIGNINKQRQSIRLGYSVDELMKDVNYVLSDPDLCADNLKLFNTLTSSPDNIIQLQPNGSFSNGNNTERRAWLQAPGSTNYLLDENLNYPNSINPAFVITSVKYRIDAQSFEDEESNSPINICVDANSGNTPNLLNTNSGVWNKTNPNCHAFYNDSTTNLSRGFLEISINRNPKNLPDKIVGGNTITRKIDILFIVNKNPPNQNAIVQCFSPQSATIIAQQACIKMGGVFNLSASGKKCKFNRFIVGERNTTPSEGDLHINNGRLKIRKNSILNINKTEAGTPENGSLWIE